MPAVADALVRVIRALDHMAVAAKIALDTPAPRAAEAVSPANALLGGQEVMKVLDWHASRHHCLIYKELRTNVQQRPPFGGISTSSA